MEKTGAVITAAGLGERRTEQNPLKKADGITIAARIVVSLRHAGVKDIVLVAGAAKEQLKKELKGFGVTFLDSPRKEGGERLDAVRTGLDYLKGRCERVFICPVEVTFFSEQTLFSLLERKGDIVIPSCRRRAGHPVLVSGKCIPAILDYRGADGLRGAFRQADAEPEYVNVEDKGILAHADEPQEVEALPKENTQNSVRVQVKVRLVRETPFFGPGTVTLLKQIAALHSVREASEKTGISYSKAWTMIREAERQSGQKLVERQPGGKFGGTASVTPFGKKLTEKYEELEREVESFAESRFSCLFPQNPFL